MLLPVSLHPTTIVSLTGLKSAQEDQRGPTLAMRIEFVTATFVNVNGLAGSCRMLSPTIVQFCSWTSSPPQVKKSAGPLLSVTSTSRRSVGALEKKGLAPTWTPLCP